MPDPQSVRQLFARISKLDSQAVAFEGTIFRSSGVLHANEHDFLSGIGASSHGGRWNRPGLLAIYASLDVITATHEAYQNILSYGFPLSSIKPRVMAAASARLSCVLDLTRQAIRRRLGFTQAELLEEDWQGIQSSGEESWTQAIGRGCCEAGYEALLVHSARNIRGTNVVIFPKNFCKTSSLKLIGANELPPHPSDWK